MNNQAQAKGAFGLPFFLPFMVAVSAEIIWLKRQPQGGRAKPESVCRRAKPESVRGAQMGAQESGTGAR